MRTKQNAYFHSALNELVYLRTYARWLASESRRETWPETVARFMDFMRDKLADKFSEKLYREIHQAILSQQIMPSMRLLQFAGPAAQATNVCVYNCAFIAPRALKDFGEILYICLCGTGVGFSVEHSHINKLPKIKAASGVQLPTHKVADDKVGWARALTAGMRAWFAGKEISFDFSLVRPAGSRLKTFGGRSAGPAPLRELLHYVRDKILQRQGQRLSSIEVHDIICKIGETVVAGGVRRSAMISLSELDDTSMRDAKQGQFYLSEPQRQLANNSATYNEKPSTQAFLQEWLALIKSGAGERGIFNRAGLPNTLPKRRVALWQDKGLLHNAQRSFIGTNPCGEIILQSKQFCNLTEVIARPEDTQQTLLKKIRLASIVGTFQASLTHFPYLSKTWQKNCQQEALLGVSISGQWDCPAVRNPRTLDKLKQAAVRTNQRVAAQLGIAAATAVTCVKPSGTVSQTVDCAPGIHPRFAPYYLRRIRISAGDALCKMLQAQGVPYHPEVGQSKHKASVYVFEFPVKSPPNAKFIADFSAIEQLEYWLMVKQAYTEHNPSVTIFVREEEWLAVAAWLYAHWEMLGGLSFLPFEHHVYQLAPYEAISRQEYLQRCKQLREVDFSQLKYYEHSDETEFVHELACGEGLC
jgi:ribonucleoside-triphosphate reductase